MDSLDDTDYEVIDILDSDDETEVIDLLDDSDEEDAESKLNENRQFFCKVFLFLRN